MDTSKFAAADFLPGRYLLVINQKAVVRASGSDALQTTHIKGSLQFWAGEIDWSKEPADEDAPITKLQVGLLSSGILAQADPLTKQEATGRISIYKSLDSNIAMARQEDSTALIIDAKVELLYERLLYQQLLQEADRGEDAQETPGETMRLHLEGLITPTEKRKVAYEVGRFSGLLLIDATDERNLIGHIEVKLENVSLYQTSGDEGSPLNNAVYFEKIIWVQPIGFKNDEADLTPTTKHIQDQIDRANQLWEPGCIHFKILHEPIVRIDPSLKGSAAYSKIAASAYVDDNGTVIFSSSDKELKNVIEIFMVDNDLAGKNGSETRRPGSGFDKVIISDNNVAANDPQLLAHELGHVVNLVHPGVKATAGKTVGSANSVMAQNQAGKPHLAINTLANSHAANNPAEDLEDPPVECTTTAVNWQI